MHERWVPVNTTTRPPRQARHCHIWHTVSLTQPQQPVCAPHLGVRAEHAAQQRGQHLQVQGAHGRARRHGTRHRGVHALRGLQRPKGQRVTNRRPRLNLCSVAVVESGRCGCGIGGGVQGRMAAQGLRPCIQSCTVMACHPIQSWPVIPMLPSGLQQGMHAVSIGIPGCLRAYSTGRAWAASQTCGRTAGQRLRARTHMQGM